MAAYDEKLLNGAGVAKLSQLIKTEIANGSKSGGMATDWLASILSPSTNLSAAWQPENATDYDKLYSNIEKGIPSLVFATGVYQSYNHYQNELYARGLRFLVKVNSSGAFTFTTIADSSSSRINIGSANYVVFPVGRYLFSLPNGKDPTFLLKNLFYDNTTSGLTATTIAGAIDELALQNSNGSSSFPSDPNSDGVYKLVNTVSTEDNEQTATITWEEDVTEEPIVYTGGTHIEVDENDTIHSTEFGIISTILGSGVGINGGFQSDIESVSTEEDFIHYLTKGIVTHSVSGGLDVNLAELYDIGVRYIKSITVDNTTGTTTQNSTTITAEDDEDVTIAQNTVSLKQGENLFIYITASDLRSAFMYDLVNALQYKNNYTNFSGFRLSSYLNGIDSALSARVPDALVSTDTAPSTNNTINWVYS